jgi:hypothetical protein
MGEKRREQIESELQEERDELRANLDELRDRVRSATDWRQQFRNNPMLGVGLAFGGGLVLASLLRRAASGERSYAQRGAASGHGQLLHVWEAIQSALIGVAASKLTGALGEFVPGFHEHFAKTPGTRGPSESGNGHGVEGEGNYEAARRHRADVERYVRSADVPGAAHAAAPRSKAEAAELEAAEEAGRARARKPRS